MTNAMIIVGAMLAAGLAGGLPGQGMGAFAVVLAAVNVVSGFLNDPSNAGNV